jgi:hypothetical protein
LLFFLSFRVKRGTCFRSFVIPGGNLRLLF